MSEVEQEKQATPPSTALAKSNGNGAVVAKPVEQLPQYVQGFEGIATEPFPQSARDVLGAPVNPDEVEIKPDGIVYISHVVYRRILTRAFGAGGWALAPRTPSRVMGNLVVYHGALFALGRFVSEAVGECQYHANNDSMSYASALEGARSDCLTRCCKDLGVATELWDKSWRDWWQANYAVCEWKEAKTGKWAGQKRPHWTKIDKAKKGGAEPTARNVGGPAKEATAVPKAPSGTTNAPATSQTAPSTKTTLTATSTTPEHGNGQTLPDDVTHGTPDIGEAASYEEQQAVRNAAKACGWAPQKAGAWLKKHFRVPSSGALSKQQAADVLMCLLAAAKSEAAYRDVMAVLAKEGRAFA
jgi:hypothetical protein